MITQKAICLKVDTFNLEQLDKECYVSTKKRNKAINEAIAMVTAGVWNRT